MYVWGMTVGNVCCRTKHDSLKVMVTTDRILVINQEITTILKSHNKIPEGTHGLKMQILFQVLGL